MLTFKLEQPFNQTDIDIAIEDIHKKSTLVNKKLQKIGFVTIILVVLTGYIIDLPNSKDATKAILLMFPLTFGLFNLLHPYMRRFFCGVQIPQESATFEYLPASTITGRNCDAFIQMPGMEQYKEYVEKVKHQSRSLINLECDAIIKHYQSLV